MCKGCEIRPMDVYCRYLKRLESADVLTNAQLLFLSYFNFLNDPECGFSWGLIQQPPVQQTGAYPIELIACKQFLRGCRL